VAGRRKLKHMTKTELEKRGMKVKRHERKFDPRKRSKSVRDDVQKWAKSRKAPRDLPPPKQHRLKGMRFRSEDVQKLHILHRSKKPIMEAMDQEVGPDELLNLSYSVLTVHQYQQLKDEYNKKLAEASSKKEEAQIKKEWNAIVRGAVKGFSRAGVKGFKQEDLDGLAKEIAKDPEVAKSIKKIADSGVREKKVGGNPDYAAGEIPVATGVVETVEDLAEAYFELCKHPIEDSYKWKYTFNWAWQIRLKIWCPTWFEPLRFCWTTFTIAGISAGISLDIGYRISCTGASAWGLAGAYTCATLLGIQYCFECKAEVVGVLGFTDLSDTGECVYGAGVNCEFSCTWRGIPVVFLAAGIGLVIKAPCPTATPQEWADYLVEKAKEELQDSEEEEEEEEETSSDTSEEEENQQSGPPF
jgi:hypothetical protein